MARGPVHFGAPHLVFAAAAVAVSVLFWRSTVKTGCETGLLCKRIFFGLGNGDTFGHTGNGRAGTMPEIDFQSVEFIGGALPIGERAGVPWPATRKRKNMTGVSPESEGPIA